MHRRVDHDRVRVGVAQPVDGCLAAVVGAVVHDDEHSGRAGVGLLAHELAHQGHERTDPGGGRGGGEDLPGAHVERGQQCQGAGLGVHLVCDNYATHNTAEIKTWLARHPRFRVHFTPTGSSWMNQVERWFGLLTDKLICRGVHTSVQALENDIREWIATWNDNPRPYTWTKTADEILASLADYLAKLGTATTLKTQV